MGVTVICKPELASVMSDDDESGNTDRDISDKFAAIERELRAESFFDSIKDQLPGMFGMAFMFVITILIALFIRQS